MTREEETIQALRNHIEVLEERLTALEQEPKYCDRNICKSNEYNGIGCDECEVTKSQEKILEPCKNCSIKHELEVNLKKWANAYRRGLEDGRKELCEDAVSRQAVLDLVNADWKYEDLESDIKNLSPVIPIHRDRTVQDFADKCRECGKQKKGKWIYHEKSVSTGFKDLRECSCCHCYFRWEMPRNSYCPNCGAEMESEDA